MAADKLFTICPIVCIHTQAFVITCEKGVCATGTKSFSTAHTKLRIRVVDAVWLLTASHKQFKFYAKIAAIKRIIVIYEIFDSWGVQILVRYLERGSCLIVNKLSTLNTVIISVLCDI